MPSKKMLKQEKNKNRGGSISQNAFRSYGKTLTKMFPWLLNFFFISIAVLAIGFLASYSFVLTVPLVIIPFFFALQMATAYTHVKNDMDGRRFYGYYRTYFTPMAFGSYRVIRSSLISALIALVVSILFGVFYVLIGDATGMGISNALNRFMEAYYDNDLNSATALLSEEPIASFMLWLAVVEIGAFLLSFVFHMMRYGIVVAFHISMPGANSRTVNAIYRGALRSSRTKGYNKDYFAAMWPLFILALTGFSLGVYLSYLIVRIEPIVQFLNSSSYFSASNLIWTGGALVMVLFLLPLLPYYFNVINFLFEKYQVAFAQFSVDYATNALNQLKIAKELTEEEQKEIEKSLEEARKQKEELEKRQDALENPEDSEKEKEDSPKNHHDPSEYE